MSKEKLSPAVEILTLKKQLAEANKRADTYKTTLSTQLRDVKLKGISKEEINKHYDADNPQAIQTALTEHATRIDGEIVALLATADGEVSEYMDKEFDDVKIDMQSSLAAWNATNGTDMSYDQLMDDVAPRILKSFEKGDIKTKDELFDSAKAYLDKVGAYQPTTPPTPGADVPTGKGAAEGSQEEEPAEIYY